jgi:hypothetical protein
MKIRLKYYFIILFIINMDEDIEDTFIIKHTEDITDLFIKFKEISKSHGSLLFTNKRCSSYDLIDFLFQYSSTKKNRIDDINDMIDDDDYIIDQEFNKI